MSGRDAGLLWAALLVVLGAGAVWWWFAGAEEKTPDVVTSGASTDPPTRGSMSRVTEGSERAPLPRGDDMAGSRSPHNYVIVSAETEAPIEGAAVRLSDGGRLLGTTDADGAITVRDYRVAALVFSAPDHLVALYMLGQRPAEELGADGERFYKIPLEPDRYSIPFALSFVSSDGGAPPSVQFRLRPEVENPRSSVAVPRERLGPDAPVDDELSATWAKHVLVAGLHGFEALPHHFGGPSNTRVFEGPAEITVRFAASGLYQLEAVSSDGELAQRAIRVGLSQKVPLVIELAPGFTMKGIVSSALGGRVKGAVVRPASPLVGVRPAIAGDVGEFELGPVPDEPFELDVRHHDFESQRTSPRRPTLAPQRIVLQPRARWEVQGRVRVPPGSKPVAGAEVAVVWRSGHEVRVRTGPDGWFSCVTTADEAEIVIRAEGFQVYRELVTRPAAPSTYDLLPASPRDRVKAGLTALLIGEVRGPDDQPRPGMTVHAIPDTPAGFAGKPGRRISSGGVLSLPHSAVADEHGRFELECRAVGRVRLQAMDGNWLAQDGLSISVTLGRITRDLLVRASR